MSTPKAGQYGPEALIDTAGRAQTGATVTVPNGYTATVDGLGNLTITGPPTDALTYRVTPIGGTGYYDRTVPIPPAPSDLTALATKVGLWQPTTAYAAGQPVINPSGELVRALASFTSGASYNAANWSTPPSGTYGTLAGPTSFAIDTSDAAGNPTQVTEHYGAVTVVRTYTWNADGSPATETVAVNSGAAVTKTFTYSNGVLAGAA